MNIEKRSGNSFDIFLIIMAAVTIYAGIYESLMHKYRPDYSMLNLIHSYGYLKRYAIDFAPGKSIWRLFGWIGSVMMIIMMFYSVRKRCKRLHSWGVLRTWLSAHMFLGIMGPALITFHTTSKFSGLVATSYWCMISTMIFGIFGRYIYIQIPRSIAGVELEEADIDNLIYGIDSALGAYAEDIHISNLIDSANEKITGESMIHVLFIMLRTDIANLIRILILNRILKRRLNLTGKTRKNIVLLVKRKAALIRKRNFLATARNLLHYWQVIHIPLAVVMFLIMFLHIVIYYLFRPETASVL